MPKFICMSRANICTLVVHSENINIIYCCKITFVTLTSCIVGFSYVIQVIHGTPF